MTLAPPRPADLDPQSLATAVADVRRAGSLTFKVDGELLTYTATGDDVVESNEGEGDTVVVLSRQDWQHLVGQIRTPVGLLLAGALTFEKGDFPHFAAWDRVLRYLHNGVPPYSPDRADLKGRDPRAAMTLADSDEELREQLTTMGFLLVKGVFTPEEMAAANAEVDRLAARATPGDNESWFVETDEGQQVCRLVYATQRSETLKSLEQDPRIARLAALLDPTLRVAPDRMEGSAVLIKVPGKTRGLSNIPWHQDCGTGGHAIFCPSVSMGIQLTGSSRETGNLLMVPGSQGQTLPFAWTEAEDVPVVEVDTEPGDVTVHIQDVMHASPQPTAQGGRRTMYVTHYPATLWDHIGPGEAYNDLVRNRTKEVGALA